MIDFTNQIVLSLSDLWIALKRYRRHIFIAALLFSLLGCLKALCSTPMYVAEGEYLEKEERKAAPSSFLQVLSKQRESAATVHDPVFSLQSYDVLREVVLKLNMQASIKPLRSSRIKQKCTSLWRNLLTAKAYRRFGKKPILPYPVTLYDVPELTCTDVTYANANYSTKLKVVFSDATNYAVYQHNALLGRGVIGIPFIFSEGSFTLEGASKKSCFIQLTPIKETIERLLQRLSVQQDDDFSNLLHVEFSHPNPHVAQQTLNSIFSKCQDALRNEGKGKIEHQLGYLSKRRDDLINNIETLLYACKNVKRGRMEEGEFLISDLDERMLSEIQLNYQRRKSDIALQLQQLYLSDTGVLVPLEQIIQRVEERALTAENSELTAQKALDLIETYKKSISENIFQTQKYAMFLHHLQDEAVNPSLIATLGAPISLDVQKLTLLNKQLLDAENYSAGEQRLILEEIELEKRALSDLAQQHLNRIQLDQEVLQKQTKGLTKEALALLLQEYQITHQSLAYVTEQLQNYPDRWIEDQKIELSKSLQLSSFSKLSHMIEEKNIEHHIEYIESKPHTWAVLPRLPTNCRLRLWGLLGALAGTFFMCGWICLREIYYGPTASEKNLAASGRRIATSLLDIANGLEETHSIFFGSKERVDVETFVKILEGRGDRVQVLEEPPEEAVGSRSFTFDKSYDRVVVTHRGIDPMMGLLARKCEQTIYQATDERAEHLSKLPEKTVYLFEPEEGSKRSFLEIQPILQKFFAASFSAQPSEALHTPEEQSDTQTSDPSKT